MVERLPRRRPCTGERDDGKNLGVSWDASRPVPFRRLLREWLIFAPILVGVLWLMQRDTSALTASLIGLAASLPVYLGFGFVLARFGYQRRTLADLRTPRAGSGSADPTAPTTSRSKPAPTRRTSGGGSRPNRKRR